LQGACICDACSMAFILHGPGGGWADVRPDEVAFIAGHSYNVWRMKTQGKLFEARDIKTTAKYLAYCSNMKDQTGLWPSRKDIVSGSVHIVSQIIGFQSPGREDRPAALEKNGKWLWEWLLRSPIIVGTPITLPSGVGRGIRFPRDPNDHLKGPFQELKKFLMRCGRSPFCTR
jgi:hypothetical protein